MKREFMVERQGRWFVLYAGLLDEAHAQGLKAIRTQLVQVPTPENGHLAICTAQVETANGTFSGIGDASPESVSRMMLPHLIRMAETRAKARALRDVINCGAVALEELAEVEESQEAGANAPVASTPASNPVTLKEAPYDAPRPEEPASSPRQPNGWTVPPSAPTNGGLATPNQVRAIYLIARDQHSLSESEVDDKSKELYGSMPAELTKKQASDLITTLKAKGSVASPR